MKVKSCENCKYNKDNFCKLTREDLMFNQYKINKKCPFVNNIKIMNDYANLKENDCINEKFSELSINILKNKNSKVMYYVKCGNLCATKRVAIHNKILEIIKLLEDKK